MGTNVLGLFINKNNTIYVAERNLSQVQVWLEGNMTAVRTISGGLSSPSSIFVTSNGNIFVDNGGANHRVDMWTLDATTSVTVMYVNHTCYGLFVDIYESVYCSVGLQHKVVKQSANDSPNTTVMIAGNGTQGAGSNMLDNPRGIFVDTRLNLYVAECGNHRIQFFGPGQSNGTTVMGNRSNQSIALLCPNSVILDADGHLFVAEYTLRRIIGWGPSGYQCIASCNSSSISNPTLLAGPYALSFDIYGNLYVADYSSNRIEKFLILNDDCGESCLVVFSLDCRC